MTDNVTDLLKREHYLFARLLDGLEVMIRRERAPDPGDRLLVRDLLRFFESSVDGLHQDKEERVLLARLLARSARSRIPMMAHFCAHHRRDRQLLAQMGAELASFEQWSRSGTGSFVTHAGVYIRFQRRHMCEENQQLFPVIQSALSPEDDHIARAGFRRLECAHGLTFEPEAMQLLARMAAQLGEVPASPETVLLDDGVSTSLRIAR